MNLLTKSNFQKVAVILFYIMFMYSGFTKIFRFTQKVDILGQKTGLPYSINVLGMFCVILLELVGSMIMILDTFLPNFIPVELVQFTKSQFLLFLIVVTLLYHPPTGKMIPFLSNLTTFAGLLYMYSSDS